MVYSCAYFEQPGDDLEQAQQAAADGREPHANGGLLLRDLIMPDFRDYAVKVAKPGVVEAESTRVQGQFIRDVLQ